MTARERILVFVPMYNCERQIRRVLAQFDEATQRYFTELIVVDNGSTDGSVEAAIEGLQKLQHLPGAILSNVENYNLGGSHKVAFDYAIANGFDYVVVLHGDDQADIHDLLPHLDLGTHRQYDSMLGSRFMQGSKLTGYSRFRTFGNRAFNALFSAAARRWLTDLGSGLNLYRVEYLRSRFYVGFPNTLTFNNYLLLAGVHRGSRFTFFPITWREEDQRSNVKLVRQSMQTFKIVGGYARDAAGFLEADHTGRPGLEYRSRPVARTRNGDVQRLS